jgi:hypothetical protein
MREGQEAWVRAAILAIGIAGGAWTLSSMAPSDARGSGGASAYRACGGQLTATAAAGGVDGRCSDALRAASSDTSAQPVGVALGPR